MGYVNYSIGNRTRDLPACGAEPQPTNFWHLYFDLLNINYSTRRLVTLIVVNSISLKTQLQIGEGHTDKYLTLQHPTRLTVFRFITLNRTLQTEGWDRYGKPQPYLELLINERLLLAIFSQWLWSHSPTPADKYQSSFVATNYGIADFITGGNLSRWVPLTSEGRPWPMQLAALRQPL